MPNTNPPEPQAAHTPEDRWEAGYGDGITGARCAPHVYLEDQAIACLPIKIIGSRHVVAWVLESVLGWEQKEAGTSPSPTEAMKADAALIAAAPALLAALKHLAKEAEGFCSMADRETHGNTNIAVLRERIWEAEDAIRRATEGK